MGFGLGDIGDIGKSLFENATNPKKFVNNAMPFLNPFKAFKSGMDVLFPQVKPPKVPKPPQALQQPDYSAISALGGPNRGAGFGPGYSSTLLTGSRGIAPNSVPYNTLLGG